MKLTGVLKCNNGKMKGISQRSVFFGILFTMVVFYVSWSIFSKQLITATGLEQTLLTSCNWNKFKDITIAVNQTDPCLVDFVKKKMVVAPRSPETMKTIAYSRREIDVEDNIEKLKWVQMLVMDGAPKDTQFFFVESGAHDGRFLSTTLRLETLHGWNGVLIEPMPSAFKKLLKNRKVWAVNAALCVTPHPDFIDLFVTSYGKKRPALGALKAWNRPGVKKMKVPCLPLYTILAALNVDVVDYLSLDVESLDLLVLNTVPFDKVTFKILMVEYFHIPGPNKIGQFKDLLEPKSYHMIANISFKHSADLVFVHDSVYQQKKSIISYLSTI